MRRFTKSFMVILLAISILATFTACKSDEIAFVDSVVKTANIKSANLKTTMSLNIDTDSSYITEGMFPKNIYNFLNCLTFTMDQSYIQDRANSAIQTKAQCGVSADDMSFKSTIWVDAAKDKLVETFKIPTLAKLSLPEGHQDAEYLVMDINALADSEFADGMESIKETMPAAFEFEEKYMAFLQNYAKAAIFDMSVIKLKEKTRKGFTYEIKLSDKELKSLIRLVANDFMENKKTRETVKALALDIASYYQKIAPTTFGIDIKSQVESVFGYLDINKEEATATLKVLLDRLDATKLLGEDGIKATFNVTPGGYIVGMDYLFDFSLDLVAAEKLFAPIDLNSPSAVAPPIFGDGMYFNVKIKSSTVVTDINNVKSIDMPQITKENSIDYVELLKENMNIIDDPDIIVEKEQPLPEGEIGVKMYGQRVNFEHKPVMIDDTLYVPLGGVVKAMYGKYWWDAESNQLYVQTYGNLLHYTPGDDKIYADGLVYVLTSPTKTIDTVGYVPLRSFSKVLNGNSFVTWVEEENTAYVGYGRMSY